MTERAPTGQSTLEKERVLLERKRKKLEYEERIFSGKQAFGFYDENVEPAEGELTYEQYLEQRPAEGIVRAYNGRYIDAQTSKPAKRADYEAQYATKIDNNSDRVRIEEAVISNEGKEYEAPYSNLGFAQLAKEYSLAKSRLDDKGRPDQTAMQDIKEALVNFVENDIVATSTDAEAPEQAQARYEAELERFDTLVKGFDKLHEAVGVKAAEETPDVTPKNFAEDNTQHSSEQADESQRLDTEAASAGEQKPEPETEVKPEVEVDPVITYTVSSEPQRLVVDLSENGPIDLPEQPNLSHLATALPGVDTDTEPSTPSRQSYREKLGQPRVIATDTSNNDQLITRIADESAPEEPVAKTAEQPVVSPAEKVEVEEPSRKERIKNWFKKEGAHFREYGGVAYFSEKWERARAGIRDNTLDRGITDEMTEEEKEKRRRKNRIVIIAGAAAVAGLSLWAASRVGASHHDINGTGEGVIPTPNPNPNLGGSEAVEQVQNLPLTTGEVVPGADVLSAAPEVAIPAEAFNIPSGMGGERLLTNLGIDPSKWYGIENTLIDQFPNDFYRMADGHVGFAHTGMLPPDAQDIIKSVK